MNSQRNRKSIENESRQKFLSVEDVIAKISEVLKVSDGVFIENIANSVFENKVTYQGDSIFTQEA